MLFAIGAGPQVKAVDGTPTTRRPCHAPTCPAANSTSRRSSPTSRTWSWRRGWPRRRPRARRLHHPGTRRARRDPSRRRDQQLTQLGDVTGHPAGAAARSPSCGSRSPRSRRLRRSIGPATYYYELDQTYYTVTSTRSSDASSVCSASPASRTPRRARRRAVDTRSCPPSSSSRPIRATSSWPTRDAASSPRPRWPNAPGWSAWRRSRWAGRRARRRHRVPVGPADHRPAAHGRARCQSGGNDRQHPARREPTPPRRRAPPSRPARRSAGPAGAGGRWSGRRTVPWPACRAVGRDRR